MLPERKRTKYNIPLLAGLVLTLISILALGLIFYPVISNEINYKFNKPDPNAQVSTKEIPQKKVIVAVDKDFSIIIPKIGANAKVIANIDPLNSQEYQLALAKGVAHAKGTAFPNERGNTFLFAHSSDSFLNANIYNAVFYLLNKLQPEDIFYIAYKEKLYKYKTVKVETITPGDTKYYGKTVPDADQTATLMTCWPPATTLKRLIVVGVLQ